MIARSLLTTGNNLRLKKVIERARAGKVIRMACIGGSITEGWCASKPERTWVSLFLDGFNREYSPPGKRSAVMVNAGMGGTPSTLGMIRYKRDVVDRLGGEPDLVIVEFAVNDRNDVTGGVAYESLVRSILMQENRPAVILLFTLHRNLWNLEDRLIPVGDWYELPMVSIRSAIAPAIASGELPLDSYFADAAHPTDRGHAIMADCLLWYVDAVDRARQAKADIRIPEGAKIGTQYVGIRMIDSAHIPADVSIDAGDFSAMDSAVTGFLFDRHASAFPDNWFRSASPATHPFRMRLTCKNLCVVYKLSPRSEYGTALVSIDGVPVKRLESSRTYGWNNPWTDVLLDNPTAEMHTVTIEMEEGASDKLFSILAFGYTQ